VNGWCRRLPGGWWLISSKTRSVIAAALEDAAAYRAHTGLDGPDGCTGCPTASDLVDCALLGVDAPGPCEDHQLDIDAAAAYEDLLDRMGVRDGELAKLRAMLYPAECQDQAGTGS
jgi:hypothetical protein